MTTWVRIFKIYIYIVLFLRCLLILIIFSCLQRSFRIKAWARQTCIINFSARLSLMSEWCWWNKTRAAGKRTLIMTSLAFDWVKLDDFAYSHTTCVICVLFLSELSVFHVCVNVIFLKKDSEVRKLSASLEGVMYYNSCGWWSLRFTLFCLQSIQPFISAACSACF